MANGQALRFKRDASEAALECPRFRKRESVGRVGERNAAPHACLACSMGVDGRRGESMGRVRFRQVSSLACNRPATSSQERHRARANAVVQAKLSNDRAHLPSNWQAASPSVCHRPNAQRSLWRLRCQVGRVCARTDCCCCWRILPAGGSRQPLVRVRGSCRKARRRSMTDVMPGLSTVLRFGSRRTVTSIAVVWIQFAATIHLRVHMWIKRRERKIEKRRYLISTWVVVLLPAPCMQCNSGDLCAHW